MRALRKFDSEVKLASKRVLAAGLGFSSGLMFLGFAVCALQGVWC